MPLDVWAGLFADDLDAVADGLDALRAVPHPCPTEQDDADADALAGLRRPA